MKIKFIFKIFFFLLFTEKVVASFELNDRVQQAYLQITRLRFTEGKELLDTEQLQNPGNQLPLLYDSYLDFLKAFISEEKIYFDVFKRNADGRLKKLGEGNSPFCLYAKSELILQDAMLRIKFHEYVSAAWEIRKAYKMTEENIRAYPDFLLNRKVAAFLHVLVGSVPENYRWLSALCGMKGTLVQGTSELKALLKETKGTAYSVYEEEILFYLSSISNSFSRMENNTGEIQAMLRPWCSKNILLRYCYSNLLMKEGKNEEAIKVLSDSTSVAGTFPFFFLEYKIGLAKLRKLDDSAEINFRNYIANFKGANYIRSAYQKLAWISLLRGEKEKYVLLMNQSQVVGSDFVDEDKEASAEAHHGEIPNPFLLRSRLLFDGGYYRQSLSEIAGRKAQDFSRYKDQLEVTYRFARILEKLNEQEQAVIYYEETIKNGGSSSYYFAANAALLLGMMYEEKNETEKARTCYRKCLAFRHHEYQNSIDQKAEAGLERLNVKN
ncbi:MAG: hypothetical protein NT126_07365 [Bacteroidetes bacterium]|nr:hypothetical protein [Bacteroidota bacterium]